MAKQMKYRTRDGDVLDAICYRHYGETNGYVEAVLAANLGLADKPPVLPAGLIIVLPDLPRLPPRQPVLRLWD